MSITLYALAGRDAARHFSPHVWKVEMALAHKGLPYTVKAVGFVEIPDIEGGFSKTVPVIRDGDTLVNDSFDIALHLERAYPDRPTLFGGPGGEAMARFVERWSFLTLHAWIGRAALMDIFHCLKDDDRAYFRTSREARFGKALEETPKGREETVADFRKALEPLRQTLSHQQFLGGEGPLFADYIVFGALQWMRVVCPMNPLESGDPVANWFERCLDLHGGVGRAVAAAA